MLMNDNDDERRWQTLEGASYHSNTCLSSNTYWPHYRGGYHTAGVDVLLQGWMSYCRGVYLGVCIILTTTYENVGLVCAPRGVNDTARVYMTLQWCIWYCRGVYDISGMYIIPPTFDFPIPVQYFCIAQGVEVHSKASLCWESKTNVLKSQTSIQLQLSSLSHYCPSQTIETLLSFGAKWMYFGWCSSTAATSSLSLAQC